VTAPRAIAFREAADQRYRRTCAFGMPPVNDVLRALPRPVRIDTRVYVDARPSRILRVERAMPPLLARLVERERHEEAIRASDHPSIAAVRRPATPVAMVLVRKEAGPESVVSAAAVEARNPWPAPSTARSRVPNDREDTAALLSASDVNHLTDRVVAAIDRRLLAARERLGR
jgi:hypothetical protein